MRPELTRSRPATTIISVDLPAPDGPTTATASPWPIERSMPRRMLTGPTVLGRVTCTPASSSRAPLVETSVIGRVPGDVTLGNERGRWAGTGLKGGPLLRIVNVLTAALAALCLIRGQAEAAPLRVLMLGDSLTAGFGLAASESLPAQLETVLKGQGLDILIQNGGVSGDTTAGGLARIDWALADNPTYALVELGANDALRGLDTTK